LIMGKVNIVYIGIIREITGKSSEEVGISGPVKVREVLSTLSRQYGNRFSDELWPEKEDPDRSPYQFLVNGKNIWSLNGWDTEVRDGDSLLISIPISGG